MTSSAVSGAPPWNFTPWRILKVHTSPAALGDQLSASTGVSLSCWSDRHRYSPVWASMSRPPWSATVSGLIEAVGTTMPALITAPDEPAPVLPPVVAGVVEVLELPHAEITAPRMGSEMPTTVPRTSKSRREIRPAANSSMMWLAISPWPARSWSSRSLSGFTGDPP